MRTTLSADAFRDANHPADGIVLSSLAAALLEQITPRLDGTMPCTSLPGHLFSEYEAAKEELLSAGLAYRFEGALSPARRFDRHVFVA